MNGIELFQAGKYQEAKTVFNQEILEDHENTENYYYLGRIFVNEQNNDKAIEYLKKAVKLASNDSDSHLWLGIAYLNKLQNSSFMEKGILSGKTLSNLRKDVELDQTNIQARIYLAGFYLNALPIAGGSIKKAEIQAKEVIKYNRTEGSKFLAEIYYKQNKTDSVLEIYDELIQSEPNNTELYYNKGMIFQDQKKFNNAFQTFEKALEIDSLAFDSMYQIGRTAVFAKRNLDRGMECFIEYLQYYHPENLPGKDSVHWRMGMIYELKEDNKSAKKST